MAGLSDKRVFLFDLDGTLVDSDAAHASAFRTTLAELEPALVGSFDYGRVRGLDTDGAFRALGVVEDALIRRLTARKREAYRELLRKGAVGAHAGAHELLAQLRARGNRLIVVTNASRGSAERALSSTGLGTLLDAVVTADDVSEPKPSPEPLLLALAGRGVAKELCLSVDDTPGGAVAAERAGIDVVLVHCAANTAAGVRCFSTLEELGRVLAGCAQ